MAEHKNPEAAGAEQDTGTQAGAEGEAHVEHDHEVTETRPEEAVDGTQAGDDDEAQVTALKDQVLRAMAEMENIKRRAARDVEHAHKFAVEKLIDDLFPVLDSLEKAVETAAAIEGAEAIAEGVGLSLKLFVDTLAK